VVAELAREAAPEQRAVSRQSFHCLEEEQPAEEEPEVGRQSFRRPEEEPAEEERAVGRNLFERRRCQ
jgi:hypothetical protein